MRGSASQKESEWIGKEERFRVRLPVNDSHEVPGFQSVSGVSWTWHRAKMLVPSVTSTVDVSLCLEDSTPSSPEREATNAASTRFERKSLNIMFGDMGRFSRTSCASSPER